MSARIDDMHPGERYGHLVVIGEGQRAEYGDRRILCRCDCGETAQRTPTDLRRGWAKACKTCTRQGVRSERRQENRAEHKQAADARKAAIATLYAFARGEA